MEVIDTNQLLSRHSKLCLLFGYSLACISQAINICPALHEDYIWLIHNYQNAIMGGQPVSEPPAKE